MAHDGTLRSGVYLRLRSKALWQAISATPHWVDSRILGWRPLRCRCLTDRADVDHVVVAVINARMIAVTGNQQNRVQVTVAIYGRSGDLALIVDIARTRHRELGGVGGNKSFQVDHGAAILPKESGLQRAAGVADNLIVYVDPKGIRKTLDSAEIVHLAVPKKGIGLGTARQVSSAGNVSQVINHLGVAECAVESGAFLQVQQGFAPGPEKGVNDLVSMQIGGSNHLTLVVDPSRPAAGASEVS